MPFTHVFLQKQNINLRKKVWNFSEKKNPTQGLNENKSQADSCYGLDVICPTKAFCVGSLVLRVLVLGGNSETFKRWGQVKGPYSLEGCLQKRL